MNVPGLPPYDADESIWNMARPWREGYVLTKYNISKFKQPQRICEIGVYSGIAALSFLAACPGAEYVGIDNLSVETANGVNMVAKTGETLTSLGYRSKIIVANSQSLESLPDGPYDLIHVDGLHSTEGTAHDVRMAWQALAPQGIIVIDNGHDMYVAEGTFLAMRQVAAPRLIKWMYTDDPVGSIIITQEQV